MPSLRRSPPVGIARYKALILSDPSSDPLISVHAVTSLTSPSANNRRFVVSRQGQVFSFGDGQDPSFQSYRYSNDISGGAFYGYKARGTQAVALAILDADNLGALYGSGTYDGSGVFSGPQGGISITAASNWNAGDHATRMAFKTTPVGSTVMAIVGWFMEDASFIVGATRALGTATNLLEVSSTGAVLRSAVATKFEIACTTGVQNAELRGTPIGGGSFIIRSEGGGIVFQDAGGTRWTMATTGLMTITPTGGAGAPVLTSTGGQLLTTRRTGWAAATNTKTRTTFDTTTVTLPILAAHVGALIDDLITHGLIGA